MTRTRSKLFSGACSRWLNPVFSTGPQRACPISQGTPGGIGNPPVLHSLFTTWRQNSFFTQVLSRRTLPALFLGPLHKTFPPFFAFFLSGDPPSLPDAAAPAQVFPPFVSWVTRDRPVPPLNISRPLSRLAGPSIRPRPSSFFSLGRLLLSSYFFAAFDRTKPPTKNPPSPCSSLSLPFSGVPKRVPHFFCLSHFGILSRGLTSIFLTPSYTVSPLLFLP